MNYQDFLKKKTKRHIESGFDIELSELNTDLFPFQSHIVQKALKVGRYAIFADCGLGKTFMQLEWAHHVSIHTDKPVLILCPLAVAGQTIKEGERFNINIERYAGQVDKGVYITNYEQLKNIEDVSVFSGVVLDESSILKNFSGKIKTSIIDLFKLTPYKLACTATPSPNDPLELGNHSEFLGVMKSVEMASMFFINDTKHQTKWRLKKHAISEFYQWVSTWAVMIGKPGDIGFCNDGYNLPELNIIEHQIETEKRNNGALFNDVSVSATDFNKELRMTTAERINKAALIAKNTDGQVIIWIKQNQEGVELRKLLPEAIEVKGSDKPELKEKNLLGFANNDFRILITKSKIAQFGLNYQNCNTQIFAAIDFSFEGLYQSIRRSYRFGQVNNVDIHIITTDTMQNVINSINKKRNEFDSMKLEMRKLISKYYKTQDMIANYSEKEEGENYKLYLGDCIQLMGDVESDSIDFSFFSPPFASLYTYSDMPNDVSNCKTLDEFYDHLKFVLNDIFRVLKSGRLCSMHIMQISTLKGRDGFLSIVDIRGDIIRIMQEIGFYFHAEVTIWKDPQLAAVRTKNIQLLHGQTKKDSCVNRPGLADYIITFRKPGENKEPVNHEKNGIPFDQWCKIASPVWMDINASDVLKGWQKGKGEKDEKHMTPTQLEPIKNLYTMFTNPGDTVLSPFAGIGSEGYQAIKMGRKFIGFELKPSYFNIMKQNLSAAEALTKQISLF